MKLGQETKVEVDATDKKFRIKPNDLDPKKWREYEKQGLQFFSVWDTPERDPLGWTLKTIHGSCPVEIPRQCIWRFSKEGETVLDPFVASGTTLVACARMKRNGIGIEINPKIAKVARENLSMRLDPDLNGWLQKQRLIIGDSRNLKTFGIEDESIDLVFSHPPYWNLINYSKEHGLVKGDLSTAQTLEEFLEGMKQNFSEVKRVLKSGRYFCVLIGESFMKGGKVVSLDYHLTDLALKLGFEFYTKVVKYTRLATSRMNFLNTMKYLSLRSNFFICIHDYVIVFRKP
ncbi:MAG: site-specific DNA-methyltransferase [Candidatus Bathyarchaeota archaeon]|nr:site-specific DNA-methyltransferase [Candidatus Bathyarchaeota archaeon]